MILLIPSLFLLISLQLSPLPILLALPTPVLPTSLTKCGSVSSSSSVVASFYLSLVDVHNVSTLGSGEGVRGGAN